jgi:DNA-binding NarL/FixJ family response regulator
MKNRQPTPGTPLTARELQVLAGLARGKDNTVIGQDLGLKRLTIKTHIARISRKAQAGHTSGIIGHAYRTGLLRGLAPEPRPPVYLTGRERQVLDGMARGQSNAEIGRELFLAEETIKSHAQRLFRKLQAHGRTHAVALGYQHGYLKAPAETAGRP